MNTYAIQLELHYQAERADESRFEVFVDQVKALAESHGISLGEVQSMRLSGSEYTISPCARCAHLTVNRLDVRPGDESMLPDFWFYVRRGTLETGELTCELCQGASGAT